MGGGPGVMPTERERESALHSVGCVLIIIAILLLIAVAIVVPVVIHVTDDGKWSEIIQLRLKSQFKGRIGYFYAKHNVLNIVLNR